MALGKKMDKKHVLKELIDILKEDENYHIINSMRLTGCLKIRRSGIEYTRNNLRGNIK
jgi:hypothetical protein